MTKREAMELTRTNDRLRALGISYDECDQLRRISMTLRRWFELECGNSNAYSAYAIERDEATDKPFMVNHSHREPYRVTRTPIADRERGALRRLKVIMDQYPTLTYYVQSDPRGCALYILTQAQVKDGGHTIDAVYTRGIAVG